MFEWDQPGWFFQHYMCNYWRSVVFTFLFIYYWQYFLVQLLCHVYELILQIQSILSTLFWVKLKITELWYNRIILHTKIKLMFVYLLFSTCWLLHCNCRWSNVTCFTMSQLCTRRQRQSKLLLKEPSLKIFTQFLRNLPKIEGKHRKQGSVEKGR